MNEKREKYPVTKRVNWALTCTDKMAVHYWSYKRTSREYLPEKAHTYTYPINGVISFNNHMHLLVKLNPVAHQFLLYLTQNMNPATNEFHNNASTRMYFIDFMKKHCNIKCEDKTVSRAVTKLKKVGYVIQRGKARRLIINPLYYFRGTMKEREALIRELLYEAYHPETRGWEIAKKLL